jgi:uncharacterized protein (DUF1697 family)
MVALHRWIALLRAIGPATHKKMSMQDLRDSCQSAHLEDVSTFIATGNLLFRSALARQKLLTLLREILDSYGLDNEVILRSPKELQTVVSAAPFADAAAARPNHLLIVFYNDPIGKSAGEELLQREGPERIMIRRRELCIDYVDGVARSKLSAASMDKLLAQSGTARNWNTVTRLIELAG